MTEAEMRAKEAKVKEETLKKAAEAADEEEEKQ